MQGVFVILFALSAIVFAQTQQNADSGQGCCFYRAAGFKDEIRCTGDPFNISDVVKGKKTEGVKSFFCTEGFSAAIILNNQIQELIDCGDVVNETTSPIKADLITVGSCLLRRCCFYSGKNKDGVEYCVNDIAAAAEELARVQATDNFVVGECVREWKASLETDTKKKIEVGCGETRDFPAGKIKLTSIKLTACPATKAMSEYEAVENTYEELNMENVDNAFSDEAVEYAGDFAVADTFGDDSAEFYVDAAVDNLDAAFTDDQFTESFEAETFEADQLAETFEVAQAVVDEFETDFAADPAFNLENSDQGMYEESYEEMF